MRPSVGRDRGSGTDTEETYKMLAEITETAVTTIVGAGVVSWIFRTTINRALDRQDAARKEQHEREMALMNSNLSRQIEETKKAAEIANSVETGPRSRGAEATQAMWGEYLELKKRFCGLLALERTLAAKAFADCTTRAYEANARVQTIVEPYKDLDSMVRQVGGDPNYDPTGLGTMMGTIPDEGQVGRIAANDAAIARFNVLTQTIGRLGALVHSALQHDKPIRWQEDRPLNEWAPGWYGHEIWETCKQMDGGGFNLLIRHGEQLFIDEARKGIRGLRELDQTTKKIRADMEPNRMGYEWGRELFATKAPVGETEQ